MCGIAGIIVRDPEPPAELAARATAMGEALAHRGPDGAGVWADAEGTAALAHRRLAIIDLTADGAQPMSRPGSCLTLVYNGEIYNYVELRQSLEQEGLRFQGRSDSEVLLAALEHWGIAETLPRLAGMFAFGLWDSRARTLTLARDRAGKKPLYIHNDGKRLIFASELRALERVGRFPIRHEAIRHYLSLGFIPAPQTVFEEVEEVPPGYWLRFGPDLGEERHAYWTLPGGTVVASTFAEAVEESEHRLSLAVRQRLRADVPVGIFLSGGIDSGLITALAAQATDTPVKTFTVGFTAAQEVDESLLAGLVAARYGTQHHSITLNPDIEELLPTVAKAYGEPMGDASALPTFVVVREASRHVKVVLNGEGADELFAGYRRHRAIKLLAKARAPLNLIPGTAWRALAHLLPTPAAARTPYAFLHRFVRGIDQAPMDRYLAWTADTFTEAEQQSLWAGGAPGSETSRMLDAAFPGLSDLGAVRQFMTLDFRLAMADCLLPKLDIATMAHGLEARCPFLDHRLVDWVSTLDPGIVLRGRTNKPILRELARRHLPQAVAGAPKRGFEIPLVRWMTRDLHSMVQDNCRSRGGLLAEIFDQSALNAFLDRRWQMDDARWAKRAWLLLMLALWNEGRA